MEGLNPMYVFILQEHTHFAVFQACFQVFSLEAVAEPVTLWRGQAPPVWIPLT